MRTGNGVMVLDIDPGSGGDETLAALEAVHGRLPDGPSSFTGGGGRHLLFRVDMPVPCSVGALGPGLDVRGDGGYIVAPPTLHESGRRYEWETAPWDGALPDAPAWLLEMVLKKPERRPGAPGANSGVALMSGGRNVGLFKEACRMRRGGIKGEALVAALHGINTALCHPPLEAGEVKKIARSAENYDSAEEQQAAAPPWVQRLKRTAKGEVAHSFDNLVLLASEHQDWKLESNVRGGVVMLNGEQCTDADVSRFRAEVQCVPPVMQDFGHEQTWRAFELVASKRRVDPILSYLDGLEWDGVPRVRTLLPWLDDEQAAALRGWLLGCVGRAVDPGCQFDSMVIMIGPRGGEGKSSFFRWLGGKYHREIKLDPRNLRDSLLVAGKAWILEFSELEPGFDVPAFKQFVTTRVDAYREPYARAAVERPRMFAIAGTTNDPYLLHDAAGLRRYWPIPFPHRWTPADDAARDQVWAEVSSAYRAGERWAHVALDPSAIRITDPWVDALASALDGARFTRVDDALKALQIPAERQTHASALRVRRVLTQLGYAPSTAGIWRLSGKRTAP